MGTMNVVLRTTSRIDIVVTIGNIDSKRNLVVDIGEIRSFDNSVFVFEPSRDFLFVVPAIGCDFIIA